jgi:hypothetical protein
MISRCIIVAAGLSCLIACSKGGGSREEPPVDEGVPPTMAPSCPTSSGTVTTGVVANSPVGVSMPPSMTGVTQTDCVEEPIPERTPFEPVEVDSDFDDDESTADLDDRDVAELCASLEPAIAAECELFGVGTAIAQDALNQEEFEVVCAEARDACVSERRSACVSGLSSAECAATVEDAVLCYEGRANAKGEAIANIDGLGMTCENDVYELLEAALRLSELEPAEFDEELLEACAFVDECVASVPEEPRTEPTEAGTSDAGQADAGATEADAAPVSDAGSGDAATAPSDGAAPESDAAPSEAGANTPAADAGADAGG